MKTIKIVMAAVTLTTASAGLTAGLRADSFPAYGARKVESVCAIIVNKDSFSIGWSDENSVSDSVELTLINNDPAVVTSIEIKGQVTHSPSLLNAGHTDGMSSSISNDWKVKFIDTQDGSHSEEGRLGRTFVKGHTGPMSVEFFSEVVSSKSSIDAGEALVTMPIKFQCL